MLKIKKVEYIKNYELKILFNDGQTKIVDFENFLTKDEFYYAPLLDIDYFKKVSIDEFNYTICWPNDADFAPEFLYEIGKDLKPPKRTSNIRRKAVYAFEKKRPKTKNK